MNSEKFPHINSPSDETPICLHVKNQASEFEFYFKIGRLRFIIVVSFRYCNPFWSATGFYETAIMPHVIAYDNLKWGFSQRQPNIFVLHIADPLGPSKLNYAIQSALSLSANIFFPKFSPKYLKMNQSHPSAVLIVQLVFSQPIS